jgi:hypothetical protein
MAMKEGGTIMPGKHRWRDFNGPGKPLRQEQLEAMLAKYGIFPVINEKGERGYRREQFEEMWRYLADKDAKNPKAKI